MKEESIRKRWEEFVEEYKVYFLSNEEEWEMNLEALKAYIDKQKKRPSNGSKDETTKKLGLWINTQQTNYSKREQIMKEESIRKKWEEFVEEYKVYFKRRNKFRSNSQPEPEPNPNRQSMKSTS
eukprot:4917729-Prymnesium_polylepis.1